MRSPLNREWCQTKLNFLLTTLPLYCPPYWIPPIPPNTSKLVFLELVIFKKKLRQKADRPTPKHKRQLTTWQVFHQVERKFHIQDSNRQPLPRDLGISPPSFGSLRLSQTYWWKSSFADKRFAFILFFQMPTASSLNGFFWAIGIILASVVSYSTSPHPLQGNTHTQKHGPCYSQRAPIYATTTELK